MQTQISVLDNGLRVISCARPQTETVSIGIWINTGSAMEKPEMNGISHFLEHLVFKGTKSRDSLKISEDIEDVGGHMNAYTSREFTAFYAKMLKDDAELALDVLAELLTVPLFPKEELIKEREVIIQEIKQAFDTPDDIIFDYLQMTAFPDQAIGRTILGPEQHIKVFDESTLRKYISTNYAAENMIVCAVGNIEHDTLVEMVKKRLAAIQTKTSFTLEDQTYKGGFFAEKRDIEQAHITLGFEGVNYSCENYYPAMIFSTIFGGGMSSRLFREVREKRGLVYTVYSFTNSHIKNGLFGIYAGTGENQVDELIPVVCEEIRKMRDEMVSDVELNRAKVQLKASILMSLESSSSTTEIMARQMLLFGRVLPVEEMVQRIDKVTKEDILKIAQQVFSSNPTYVLLGALGSYPSYETLQKLIKGENE